MFARPGDVDDRNVVDALRVHWGVDAGSVEYAAVGFGSHHWLAGDYFVSVDAAADDKQLRAALRTAQALRDDAGLNFVVAPIPSTSGDLTAPLTEAWVMHLYERLEVVDDTAHGPHDHPDVIELVRQIHEATPIVEHHASREDFAIWERADLEEALTELDEPWDTGPYGEPCRAELAANADVVRAALARHDRWVNAVPRDGWVVTHGEPHRGNVFRTTRGWAVVDWDTVLVAPPERDWWDIATGPGDASRRDLYRLRWSLMEVACYVAEFFDDHADDRNARESWKNYLHYLGELRV